MSKLRPTAPARHPDDSPPHSSGTDLSGMLFAARVHIDVTIPRTTCAAKMRILSRREEFEVDSETRSYLAEQGMPIEVGTFGGPGVVQAWTYERTVRLLQRAVVDPKDVRLQLAPIDDWRECDDDQIAALMVTYRDLTTRLDPIGRNAELSDEQFEAMLDAAKKKDAETLNACGSPRLTRFAITLVERQSS